MADEQVSFFLLALSGISQAMFAYPIKYFRGWRWEQMWVAQSVTSNIMLPVLWAWSLPSPFWETASRLAWQHWLVLCGWGVVWGVGGAAYGLTLTRLGASFAYSFVFGTTTLVGSVAPVLFRFTSSPRHPLPFFIGITLCIAATAGSAWAARHARADKAATFLAMPIAPPSYRGAVLLAVVAGIFSASYGLAFSQQFHAVEHLLRAGVSPVSAPLVIALPVYLGAASFAIPFGLVCAVRSRSMPLFWQARPFRNWLLAFSMAVLGVGGVFLYGVGSTRAGHQLPNIGFGIFMSFFVLGGNAIGVVTGELRERSRGANCALFASIAGLLTGAWLLHLS